MLQLDDVAVYLRNHMGHSGQFARSVRKQHGDGEDTVPQDQAMLYNRGHGDYIHVAAA